MPFDIQPPVNTESVQIFVGHYSFLDVSDCHLSIAPSFFPMSCKTRVDKSSESEGLNVPLMNSCL